MSIARMVCIFFVLDFKNVSIVGHYVKDRTKDAQFIIIRCARSAWLKSITIKLLEIFAKASSVNLLYFLSALGTTCLSWQID